MAWAPAAPAPQAALFGAVAGPWQEWPEPDPLRRGSGERPAGFPWRADLAPREPGFHDVFSAQASDLQLAAHLQREGMAAWHWQRTLPTGQKPLVEAAVRLWDPVWGEVQLRELARDGHYGRRRWLQACASALFACSPCCFVSLAPVCFGKEVKAGGSAADALRGWRRLLLSWSLALAAPQALLFLLVGLGLVADGLTDAQLFDRWGAKNAAKVLYRHQWWRLLTPALLHKSWLHFLGDMLVQLRAASMLEAVWGHTRWLIIFLLSGAFAGLASAIWSPDSLSIGSSGALCGIVGAWPPFVALTWSQALPHERLQRGRLTAPVVLSTALLAALGFAPMVDWAAHLGGLAMGAALGTLLFAHLAHDPRWCQAAAAGGSVASAGLAALAYYYFTAYVQPPRSLLNP